MNIKDRIAKKFLTGKGIEFGALCNPVAIDATKASVLYVDRLTKDEALINFPELKDTQSSIVEPDFIIDFNTDDFSSLKGYQFDFFIANHFIEHLVNPIRFLENVSRIMKQGALFFLTVPDKDFTFDRERKLTTNKHLWRDYQKGETHICDKHIKDYLLHKEKVANVHPEIIACFKENRLPLSYFRANRLPLNPFTRKRFYNFHRERSIHVHVWNKMSFDTFLFWINDKLQLGFQTEALPFQEDTPGEIMHLLRKM